MLPHAGSHVTLLCIIFTVLFIMREVFSWQEKLPLKYLLTPALTITVAAIAIASGLDRELSLYRLFIILGLCLAIGADTLLMIVEVDLLIYGIVFFFLTHVSYVTALSHAGGFDEFNVLPALVMVLILVLVYYFVGRHAGKMKIPVVLYSLALGTMAYGAISTQVPIIMAASFLFIISDTCLAINAFRRPIPHSTVVTWATYGPAQLLFALSCYL